jgi:hypothetical protein
MSRAKFFTFFILLGWLSHCFAADILRPRLQEQKTWPLGNDIQGGVTVPAGKYPNLATAGGLPLNPYTGNATRIVSDLSVPSVGEIPLAWTRYNNTRVTPSGVTVTLGSEGNWRHSYQWDFSYTAGNVTVERSVWGPPEIYLPFNSDGKGRITVIYPDGTVNTFIEIGIFSGIFVCPSQEVTDYIKISGAANEDRRANYYNDYTEFQFITSENASYGFGLHDNYFRLDTIQDSKGQTSSLTYSIA